MLLCDFHWHSRYSMGISTFIFIVNLHYHDVCREFLWLITHFKENCVIITRCTKCDQISLKIVSIISNS